MARVSRKIGFCEDPKRMWKAVTLERGNAKNNPGTLAVKKPNIRISTTPWTDLRHGTIREESLTQRLRTVGSVCDVPTDCGNRDEVALWLRGSAV